MRPQIDVLFLLSLHRNKYSKRHTVSVQPLSSSTAPNFLVLFSEKQWLQLTCAGEFEDSMIGAYGLVLTESSIPKLGITNPSVSIQNDAKLISVRLAQKVIPI